MENCITSSWVLLKAESFPPGGFMVPLMRMFHGRIQPLRGTSTATYFGSSYVAGLPWPGQRKDTTPWEKRWPGCWDNPGVHSEAWVLRGCIWTSKLHRDSRIGSTSGTGLMEAQFPGSPYLRAHQFIQTCRVALVDVMIISSVATYHRRKVVVCCHLQVSSPTNGKRSSRMAKLNWFVQAPVFQRGKIFYLWLSHPNLVASMLAFYLIFSRSLHNKYKSRMHKQSTWHLQFILVTENLIDGKFRKWQIFNIGLNNLSLLILIIGGFF